MTGAVKRPAIRPHMDHDAVERLLTMLDDLDDDDLAALYHEIDHESAYLLAVRDRLKQYIGARLDEDGALEYRSEAWLVERTQGSTTYVYNVPFLEKELKPLILDSDWYELVEEKTVAKVSRNAAKRLMKRGAKVREILESACDELPGSKSLRVTPLGDPE